MRPTIKDVARLAKVSPSTVSAAINMKGYVSKEARSRIEDAIKELDYTPRRSARDLATRTSGNIGFIVSESHFTRAEPFYTRVFLGTELEARNHDLYVLLTTVSREYHGPSQLPRFLRESNVDGVMIVGRIPHRLIVDVLKRDVPVLIIDYGKDEYDCSKVLIDNRRGVRMAVRHLLELGHRDFGFIGAEPEHPSIQERLSGFYEGLREAGISPVDEWIEMSEEELSPEQGAKVFNKIWSNKKHPSALICANDAMAMGVMNACKENNVKIPDELSIIGFDDVATCTVLDPPLTSIKVHKEDLGISAVHTLVEMIKQGCRKSRIIREGVELIIRESTGRMNNPDIS